MEEQLTDEQREILKQFRINLEDVLTPTHTDIELLKWLRARNFDLEKAEEHFREVQNSIRRMVTWNRITYGINTITETFQMPEVLQKYRGDSFLGFTKDGSAVRYITMAADFYESDFKAMRQEFEKTGKMGSGITYIINMEGFSITNLRHPIVFEMGQETLRLFQDHYPENWNNLLFINTSSLFRSAFNMFKNIMKDTLIKYIQCASKENTTELLLQYIDEDVLPVFLGGKKVDSNGDPYCREFICHGGKIPERYYLKNLVHLIQEEDPRVKVVSVGSRSVYNLSFVLRKMPATYRLEMRTENGGVSFSIFYRKLESESEHVEFPSSNEFIDPHAENSKVLQVGTKLRSESHCAPNEGYGDPVGPGLYIFQFHNTGSWFTSAIKLFYRLTIYPQQSFIETSDLRTRA